MNNFTSTTTSTSTTSTSTSLLERLLSTPTTSSAPPPTIEQLDQLERLLSTPPAPEPEVVTLYSDADPTDNTLEVVTISTAHPNFNPFDPAHIREMLSDSLPTTPWRQTTSPQDLELIPHSLWEGDFCFPSSPLSPLPPTPRPTSPPASPPSSTSSSPPPHLPERQMRFDRLKTNTSYKVQTWSKIGKNLQCTIYNRENTQLFTIALPSTLRSPTKQQRIHHIFEGNLYLRVNKINGKFHFAFHS